MATPEKTISKDSLSHPSFADAIVNAICDIVASDETGYFSNEVLKLLPTVAEIEQRVYMSDPAYKGQRKLSYVRDGKRYVTTIGRYLQKRIELSQCMFLDSHIEKIGNKVVNGMTGFTYKILYGKDLARAYRNSFGSSSCMTGSDHQYRLKLYVQNPKTVGLLTAQSGTQQARALIWKLQDGWYFVDRCYYNSDTAFKAIMDYVDNHEKHLSYNKISIVKNLMKPQRECLFTDPMEDTGDKPYLDSMCSLLRDSKHATIIMGHKNYVSYVTNSCIFCGRGKLWKNEKEMRNDMKNTVHADSLRFVCPTCMKKAHHCAKCKKIDHKTYHSSRQLTKTGKGTLCRTCLGKLYFYCEICESWRPRSKRSRMKRNQFTPICTKCGADKEKVESFRKLYFAGISIPRANKIDWKSTMERARSL